MLPTTLFGIALILGTIRLLSLDATGVTRIFGDIRQSNTLRQGAMRKLASMGEPNPLCEKRTITFGETKLDYEVCGERRIPFMIAPPTGQLPITRIDYDALFMNAIPCPSTPSNTASTTGDALKASKDCPMPPILQGGIITLENLRGDTSRVITRPPQVSIIASPGAITIVGALTLESDLLVVAGGDIQISSITSPSQETRKVTILSALGAIRVGFVSPSISVIAAGRSALAVPETPQSPPFPLPPLRRHAIIGIRAIGE